MAKMIGLSIDVDKINKDRLYKGKKGTYLKLTIAVNDEKDQFDNDVSCWEEQTEEERSSKTNKNYLGNGKVFWTNENGGTPQPTTQEEADDLPF